MDAVERVDGDRMFVPLLVLEVFGEHIHLPLTEAVFAELDRALEPVIDHVDRVGAVSIQALTKCEGERRGTRKPSVTGLAFGAHVGVAPVRHVSVDPAVQLGHELHHEPGLALARAVVAGKVYALERDAVASDVTVLATNVQGEGEVPHYYEEVIAGDVPRKELKIGELARDLGVELGSANSQCQEST